MSLNKKPLYYSERYQVDDEGNIYGIHGRKMSLHANNNGYLHTMVRIDGENQTIFAHRAVAIAFVPGYKPGLTVNHKDGNKQNNHADNLEWMTMQENIQHAHGVLKCHQGTKNHRAKAITATHKRTGETRHYDAMSDAARDFSKQRNCDFADAKLGIYRATKGLRKSYAGYYWQYD